jgi:hypothetical protein
MKPITSMFDFYQKLKTDRRYEKVACVCYKEGGRTASSRGAITFKKSMDWIEDWIERNAKTGEEGCKPMVDFINGKLYMVQRDFPEPVPPKEKND